MRKITSLNPIRRVLCFLFWPYVIIFATISKNHHDSFHGTSKTWLQCFVIPINYSCWTGLEKWRHTVKLGWEHKYKYIYTLFSLPGCIYCDHKLNLCYFEVFCFRESRFVFKSMAPDG